MGESPVVILSKEKQKVGRIVGRQNDNEYLYVSKLFTYDDGLRGATGSVLVPHTEEAVEERMDNYFDTSNDFGIVEVYHMSDSEQSLEEFAKEARRHDGVDLVFDIARLDEQEAVEGVHDGEIELVETIAVGRIFSDMERPEEVYDEELWKAVRGIEDEGEMVEV